MHVPKSFFAAALALFGAIHTLAENIIYPEDLDTLIDVTKAPYNCDPTGVRDCTAALIRLFDDLLLPTLEGQRAIEAEIANDPRESFIHPSSVENRRIDGKWQAIFPAKLNPARIVYFPNGTYSVSDTICYTFTELHNTWGNELCRQIVIRGQSEEGAIIRLADNSPGYEAGTGKAVLSFIRKDRSNVAMMNVLQNITISTGEGNPGAIGLRYFANNSGAVRNVTVTTEDPDKRGLAGIVLDRYNFSGCYFKDITVSGFDYGIQILPNRIYSVFEHVTLSKQRKAGFHVREIIIPIRGLKSMNTVPALKITGSPAHVVLTDSELSSPSDSSNAAIEYQDGVLFARNVSTKGYASAISKFSKTVLPGPNIEEYSSHGVSTLGDHDSTRSLDLPVEETPKRPWEQDLDRWVSVNSYGAKGDGLHDDTAAIQAALDSGKPVIYFQPGQYLVDSQLHIPATVKRIDFMFADLAAGETLKKLSDQGTFVVAEDDAVPLVIENLFAFERFKGEQYLIDHASTRTLVLRDLHTQTGATYTNSVSGGKVFIENVASTDQFEPNPNPMTFTGQEVWARQLNPERGFPQVMNDGGQLWVMGFKTEGHGAGFHTRNGGSTEILGGASNMGGDRFLINENSNVSAICATVGWKPGNSDPVMVVETKQGIERRLKISKLPLRFYFFPDKNSGHSLQRFLPLYVGRNKDQPLHPSRN